MAAQVKLNRLCVFCGSSNGRQAEYRDGAQALARAMVKRQIKLVFGGGSVGLMGEIARGVRVLGEARVCWICEWPCKHWGSLRSQDAFIGG